MRIQIIEALDAACDGVPHLVCELIRSRMPQEQVCVTDENPCLIHIVGALNTDYMHLVNEARKKHVCVVFTPLCSLSPWHKPTDAMKKTALQAQVVASGEMEKSLLDDIEIASRLIPCPITTTTITEEEFLAAYIDVYKKCNEANENGIWKEIDTTMQQVETGDEVIETLCRNILYAKYLYERKNIEHCFISRLAKLFISSDYDEDHMAEVLTQMNLYPFTQQLLTVMHDKEMLTEGFMPIPMKNDKVAQAMQTLITNYSED